MAGGAIGFIYYHSLYRRWSIPTGDAGAYSVDEFNYTFKNNPELNRPMTRYEINTTKEFRRYDLTSKMRDSGIVFGVGIVLLALGARRAS